MAVVLSLVAAAVYLSVDFSSSYLLGLPLAPAMKVLPLVFLALFTMVKMNRGDVMFLFLALVCAGAGDVLIAQDGPVRFNQALIAFGVAHIFYLFVFLFNRATNLFQTQWRLQIASVMWAAAGIGIFLAWPQLDVVGPPVFAYAGLLLLMATFALLSRYPFQLVGLGALLFVTSDLLLGGSLFLNFGGWASVAVWPVYFTAQFLITLGVVLTPKPEPQLGGYHF